jgi:hypothetical protein
MLLFGLNTLAGKETDRAQCNIACLAGCRSSERPFSFYERDKQRQQAALAAAAAAECNVAAGPGCRTRPETPTAFLANPVPVSTTEVGMKNPWIAQQFLPLRLPHDAHFALGAKVAAEFNNIYNTLACSTDVC